ncbi:MAG TPA: hypothetical protein VFY40_01310 [Blastocatellia bacterium]|nr:hypothetical protein [Blastocatellia bacterium]
MAFANWKQLWRIAPCFASSHILKNGRCEIHAEAPFGCAYTSTEQTKEESDAISARGLQEIAKSWRNGDLYAQLWLMLHHAGRVAPSPIEARARMRAAEESAGEDH